MWFDGSQGRELLGTAGAGSPDQVAPASKNFLSPQDLPALELGTLLLFGRMVAGSSEAEVSFKCILAAGLFPGSQADLAGCLLICI